MSFGRVVKSQWQRQDLNLGLPYSQATVLSLAKLGMVKLGPELAMENRILDSSGMKWLLSNSLLYASSHGS